MYDPYNDDKTVFISGTAGVGLPFAQALLSGLFMLPLSGAVCIALAWPWWAALAAAGLTTSLVWFASLSSWRRIVYGFEQLVGQDFDGDHQVGEPERVRIEISENGGQHKEFIDLPASLDQLVGLATGLLDGTNLTEANWTGAGNIFSKAEFNQLRAELLKRNLARWNNSRAPQQGAVLTPQGKATMRYFASMSQAGSPTLGVRSSKKS